MKAKIYLILAALFTAFTMNAKTLVVYYSFTNNVHTIVSDLRTQIDADVIRIEPADRGIDYAADGYAAGSALISAIRNNPDDAASYPAIDPVEVNMADYDMVIVAAPLWWSQMAAPLQTFLFQRGKEMAGKQIALIVSSASSGISGVVNDAKRLIPQGKFLEPNLWVRSSQVADCHSLTAQWLKDINYTDIASAIAAVGRDGEEEVVARYSVGGQGMTIGQRMAGICITQYRNAGKIRSKKSIVK
ncbi:MAG: NAD(P)H-dependent oxidoreductase [Bacteroidales bacterium]|nr:NAD(P)H-dependent oxidoreductase [Bacteroidales bacterium]